MSIRDHHPKGAGVTRRIEAGLREIVSASNDPAVLEERYNSLVRISHVVGDKLRRLRAHQSTVPRIVSHDDSETLKVSVAEPDAPWSSTRVEAVNIPGMITNEEAKYYAWLGRFYSGAGEAIEIGPWLGRSTFFIAKSLIANPRFKGRRLNVYDDFVWRTAWMDEYVEPRDRQPNHADFRALFERYTSSISPHLHVERRRLSLNDGNDQVPEFTWSGEPVEVVYLDVGRSFAVNEHWYWILRPSFIPDRTIIVMQDWRLHREVPPQWYNQTKLFTDSKQRELQLIHEVSDGGLAAFLFRG